MGLIIKSEFLVYKVKSKSWIKANLFSMIMVFSSNGLRLNYYHKRRLSFCQFFLSLLHEHDSTYQTFFQLPERTEKECRVRWLNLEHPAINHSKWTKEEDNELLNLSKKYNQRHWEKIAQELGVCVLFHSNQHNVLARIALMFLLSYH